MSSRYPLLAGLISRLWGYRVIFPPTVRDAGVWVLLDAVSVEAAGEADMEPGAMALD